MTAAKFATTSDQTANTAYAARTSCPMSTRRTAKLTAEMTANPMMSFVRGILSAMFV
jgi:hypothetical protein